MPLVTRNVFVDTEFFVKANLDFNSRTIKAFEELCDSNELNHITSTIVVAEVKRKITDHIKEALKGVTNFRRKAAVLKEYDDETIRSLFVEIDEAELEAKALAAFDLFLDTSGARIVDMSAVDGNEVIEMFFNHVSPFSVKKPNEFRDAFSLLAIRSALQHEEKVYIVSGDPDHKEFCEKNDRFVNVETLSALLDIYNKHSDQRAQFIDQFLDGKKQEIKDLIKAQLEQADAYNYSTWEDSELESFEVTDVGDFEPDIIHLDDESCQITFSVDVTFQAAVTGPDTVNGYYDREDDVLHTFGNTERSEEEQHTFVVELDLSFKAGVEEFISDDFELRVGGLGAGIEFSVEENADYDPRM
ncbi:PIN domain-containing protein [Pseudomonas putida]|uniref:PIN domain-containing protein n=1 Tax=Pseudomonas putida TaxID=303 RepID=UPI000E0D8886|nr:PIN domain-containing protein [Pseudomonas putida]MCI1037708.1 DUF4935 domain-containing protein [Pseudomonas putida]WQE52193.1 PIN domain-containing protein [Pseudomonas putida]GLO05682.1 hypothetical protein PPUJ13061_55860 [Pseudomonas putida]HDS1009111.1 DUF4935 domain-containing protein [Pseudomonas putida]